METIEINTETIQLDQLLKDIKRGKVECDGFKNPATLDFDNTQNKRITEIK